MDKDIGMSMACVGMTLEERVRMGRKQTVDEIDSMTPYGKQQRQNPFFELPLLAHTSPLGLTLVCSLLGTELPVRFRNWRVCCLQQRCWLMKSTISPGDHTHSLL